MDLNNTSRPESVSSPRSVGVAGPANDKPLSEMERGLIGVDANLQHTFLLIDQLSKQLQPVLAIGTELGIDRAEETMNSELGARLRDIGTGIYNANQRLMDIAARLRV